MTGSLVFAFLNMAPEPDGTPILPLLPVGIATEFTKASPYNFLRGLHVAEQLKPERVMSNYQSFTPASVMCQLEAQQAALGLTDQELSTAVGFERQIALTLIKQGSMKLPLNKVPAFAAALSLDPADLLRAAIRESDPALGQLIEEVFNPMSMTATEVNLIKHLRELSGDTAVAPTVYAKGVIAVVAA